MLRFRLSWRDFFLLGKPVQAPATALQLPDVLGPTDTAAPNPPHILQLVPAASPRATLQSLPEELLEAVFELFEGDYDPLKCCTLVCSKWRFLCQPKLFRLVVLSTEDVAQMIQFQRFILESAHIRAAVQQVEIHFSEAWDRRVSNLMADILELLPRPESLKLYGPRYQGRIRWKRLPQHLNQAIRAVLRRPSLKTFLIDGWMLDLHMDELNTLFLQFPSTFCNLSLLEVSDGLWGTMKVPLDTTHHGRLVLNELTISNTFAKDPKLIEWLCQPESTLDLQSLKTLRIMESRDDTAVEMLLSTTGSSLQNLELNISMSSLIHFALGFWEPLTFPSRFADSDHSIGYSSENAVNLAHCDNLRHLTLSFCVHYTEAYNSAIPLIINSLDTLLNPHHALETLTLVVYVTHPRNKNPIFPPPPISRFNFERWANLGLLLQKPRFSKVAKVTVELLHHGIDIGAYKRAAKKKLGTLPASMVVEWKHTEEGSQEDS